jgi:rubrerythrin
MDEATKDALDEALDDEYKARATYRAVLDRFGEIRPFSNIVESEERHIQALLTIYRRHEIEPPADRWAGRVEAPASVEAACRQGVEAERENDGMYARLLEVVRDPDIREVMARLREASRERHLPAFERCLQRGGGRGRGRGMGGGRGPGYGRGRGRGRGRGQ